MENLVRLGHSITLPNVVAKIRGLREFQENAFKNTDLCNDDSLRLQTRKRGVQVLCGKFTKWIGNMIAGKKGSFRREGTKIVPR